MSLIENSLQLFGEMLINKDDIVDCKSKFLKNLILGSNRTVNNRKRFYRKKQQYTIDKVIFMCKILKENEAIIAGGSVLSSFTDFFINDLDVYVNLKNSSNFINKILEMGYKIGKSCLAPAYDESFFKKNNIMSRFHFGGYKLFPIDVMVIPDNIKPQTVASNFDLSFCEIWFDGENIYANDPEGIKNKKGILKPDYNDALLKHCNLFIIKRIKKYIKRGFNISYKINNIGCHSFFTLNKELKTINKPNGTVSDIVDGKKVYPEEWVVKKIYSMFIKYQCNTNIDLYNNFILTEYTVENLFKILQRFFNIYSGNIWLMNEVSVNDPYGHEEEEEYELRNFGQNGLVSLNYLESNEDRQKFGSFYGDLKPEIVNKRIIKKIKLLIKYYLFQISHFYMEEFTMPVNAFWFDYFNLVLNKDCTEEEMDQVFNRTHETTYVNFKNEDDTLRDPKIINKDMKLLSEIIFFSDIYNFKSRTKIEYIMDDKDKIIDGIIHSENQHAKNYSFFTTKLDTVEKYYNTINIRNKEPLTEYNLIPSDLKIFNEEYEEYVINDYLKENDNNIILIWNSRGSENTLGGFKGIGLTKDTFHNSLNLIIECNIQLEKGAPTIKEVKSLENLYNTMTVGDSLNNGILLKYFNSMKDLVDKNLYRIFYLAEETYIKFFSALGNVGMNKPPYLNPMGYNINIISGLHCSEGTGSHVYNKVYCVNINKLIPNNRLQVDRRKKFLTYYQEEKNKNKSKNLKDLFKNTDPKLIDEIFKDYIITSPVMDSFITGRTKKRKKNMAITPGEQRRQLSFDLVSPSPGESKSNIDEDVVVNTRLGFEDDDDEDDEDRIEDDEDDEDRIEDDEDDEDSESEYNEDDDDSGDEDDDYGDDNSDSGDEEERINILSNLIAPYDGFVEY
jgi:hypothetical protein